MSAAFSINEVMADLKDFQRRTVDHAFSRMFAPLNPSRRFLVADEVGLGKTMVARGLIARTIQRLGGATAHGNIIYICSNAEIAAQNLARLRIPGLTSTAEATRLTLLPLVMDKLSSQAVNFISFTPGTSFDQGRRTGRKDERRLIYQMLKSSDGVDSRGMKFAMRGAVKLEGWLREVDSPMGFDIGIANAFRQAVCDDAKLLLAIKAVTEVYRDRRRTPRSDDEQRRLELVGVLRHRLAWACLGALKPDLVILDEFQRFSALLDDTNDNPSAELAQELFNYSDELRVLLLSATPYTMYGRDDDAESHYKDFLQTVRFLLLGDEVRLNDLQNDIRDFRSGLLGAQSPNDLNALAGPKERIENLLRLVMSRTERVGATSGADGMVRERILVPPLEARDLHEFRALDQLAQLLGERDPVEYWKSSPYLLNFMKDYVFKDKVRKDAKRAQSTLADVLSSGKVPLLSHTRVERFLAIDPANPRLRALVHEIDTHGLWSLLWMPPAMPYWAPRGVYAGVSGVSKQLIFSAWNVVPDALAALLSYEAERRMIVQAEASGSHANIAKRFPPRLRFSGQRDGRLRGMSALPLLFPSMLLVERVDPIVMAGREGLISFDQMRLRAIEILTPLVNPLLGGASPRGAVDKRWYWVALARLEAIHCPESVTWCLTEWSRARSAQEDDDADASSGFQAHVEQWLQGADNDLTVMGAVPPDLIEVLAEMALSSPATCALRTLRRLPVSGGASGAALRNAAVRIAEGFRSQFNAPHVIAMLQAADDDVYWQRVLQYGADGNLQALLDEYAHVLVESARLGAEGPDVAASGIGKAMFEALSLRTSTLHPDEVTVQDGQLNIEPLPSGLRTHFAVRFGGDEDEVGAVARKSAVKASFNSPFWPFVLASTSVGQEGLDFHTWCHSVVHWNLPSNPVDMEQREGRVHRFKGYAVRKNAAARHGAAALAQVAQQGDPWEAVFQLAVVHRPQDAGDLVPFWVYEHEGGATIDRLIMAMPLSRDAAKYARLRRSMALYRMVFAQPRQEDLLACLERTMGDGQALAAAGKWRIDLAPRREELEGDAAVAEADAGALDEI